MAFRVGIFGGGAVGTHLAARLALTGLDVALVARGAHLKAIQDTGLVLRTNTGEKLVTVKASANPAELGVQDVVFVTVKANSLAKISSDLVPFLSPNCLVVFAQNGVPWWYPLSLPASVPPPPQLSVFELQPSMLSLLTPAQVVGAVVQSSSEIVSPGCVLNSSIRNGLVVGYVDDRDDDRIRHLRSVLKTANFESPAVSCIRRTVWLKILRNMSSSSIAAATFSSTSAIKKDPMLGQTFKRIVSEMMAVAACAGYPLDKLTSPERMLEETGDAIPSLLQDIRLGRHVEIKELLIAPLEFGRSASVPTPTADAVVSIIRYIAAERQLLA